MIKSWDLESFADNIALKDDNGQSVTYRSLAEETDRIAEETDRIAERVGQRCLVFSLCRNEIGSVIGYTAFIRHGIVPVLLNSHLEEDLLHNLLDTYSPKYLWVPEDMQSGFMGMETVYSSYNYCLLKTGYGKDYPLYDELGLLLTTSGSTGSPKFVRQSYENIFDNANSIVKYNAADELHLRAFNNQQPFSCRRDGSCDRENAHAKRVLELFQR